MKRACYRAWARDEEGPGDGVCFPNMRDDELENLGWSDANILLLNEALASIARDEAGYRADLIAARAK